MQIGAEEFIMSLMLLLIVSWLPSTKEPLVVLVNANSYVP
jgi:hypothetical protein